jgi:glycine/D-amino acid oxidase-like deaminating enzyme
MLQNRSPWLHHLNRTRDVVSLSGEHSTDVVIVGGGIAGVVTAYFLLKDTTSDIVLLEADRVAHGATGHNAGQLTSYFERGFASMAEEYGLALAADAQASVEGAWDILAEIHSAAHITTPVHTFTGYAGCSTPEQLGTHLENNRLRAAAGLPTETILVAESWKDDSVLPPYKNLYSTVPAERIVELLETHDHSYGAVVGYRKGCMNSARFTEELASHLLQTYPTRFSLYEQSPVRHVRLTGGKAEVTNGETTVAADHVVLATNGFKHFTLVNEDGPDIDPTFHHDVLGRIGYMVGYLEEGGAAPTALSYFPHTSLSQGDPTGESYYYLTRRPHDNLSLICAGGPDAVLPNDAVYDRTGPGREDMQEAIDEFLRTTYTPHPRDTVEYAFSWHGLMGFTPTGILTLPLRRKAHRTTPAGRHTRTITL